MTFPTTLFPPMNCHSDWRYCMEQNNQPSLSLSLDEIKGIIQYPCCPKQNAVIALDAHGRVSVQCANCGRFLLIDNDRMTASITKPCNGVAALFKNAG